MNSFKKFLMKPLKNVVSRFSRHMQNGANNHSTEATTNFGNSVGYLESFSKHRMFLPIYDLAPKVHYLAWVAPNATLSN
jgi:hypothetical protein